MTMWIELNCGDLINLQLADCIQVSETLPNNDYRIYFWMKKETFHESFDTKEQRDARFYFIKNKLGVNNLL